MEGEEIPISNTGKDDPFIDEADEEDILEEDILEEVEISSEVSEDIGGYNELPIINEIDILSFELGDIYIFVLEKRETPFLARIIEIIIGENLLKVEDDTKKILLFKFENNEIIM